MSGNGMGILELLDKLSESKLDARGRIYIPKAIREKLSLRPGDKVYLKVEEKSFVVLTVKAIKKLLVKDMKL